MAGSSVDGSRAYACRQHNGVHMTLVRTREPIRRQDVIVAGRFSAFGIGRVYLTGKKKWVLFSFRSLKSFTQLLPERSKDDWTEPNLNCPELKLQVGERPHGNWSANPNPRIHLEGESYIVRRTLLKAQLVNVRNIVPNSSILLTVSGFNHLIRREVGQMAGIWALLIFSVQRLTAWQGAHNPSDSAR